MRNHPPSYSQWLGLTLLLFATACGLTRTATSSRQVLPSFDSRLFSNKALVIVPLSPASIEKDHHYPIPRKAMLELAREHSFDDPELALADDWTQASLEEAQGVRERSGASWKLASASEKTWPSFVDHPDGFTSITLDGKLRYQVPKAELLAEAKLPADFAIVLGPVKFSIEISTTGSGANRSTHRSVDCTAHFLVWDYAQKRALAEGEVETATGFRRDPSVENLRTLAGRVIKEILTKPPFVPRN